MFIYSDNYNKYNDENCNHNHLLYHNNNNNCITFELLSPLLPEWCRDYHCGCWHACLTSTIIYMIGYLKFVVSIILLINIPFSTLLILIMPAGPRQAHQQEWKVGAIRVLLKQHDWHISPHFPPDGVWAACVQEWDCVCVLMRIS